MLTGFLQLLNPICPHITEELWSILGNKDSIAYQKWPEFDETKIIEDTIEIPVQINGKVKATVSISLNEDESSVKEKVWQEKAIKDAADGKNIVKEIYVKNKIYNIVIK